MKNHMFALCLSLFAVSCDSKESHEESQSLSNSAMWEMFGSVRLKIVSSISSYFSLGGAGLGWVDYPDSQWMEVDPERDPTSKYVVQMGMTRSDSCTNGFYCYGAERIDNRRDFRLSLCPTGLESSGISGQYSAGGFTGVLVDWQEQPVVITVRHGVKYITVRHGVKYRSNVVLFDHVLNTNAYASPWLTSDKTKLVVPAAHVAPIVEPPIFPPDELCASTCDPKICPTADECRPGRKAVDSPLDLMMVELSGDIERPGVRLADSVSVGTKVYAIGHNFGLPMKKSTPLSEIKRCDPCGLHCFVEIDLAVGGSGSPLFTESGELAGILVGTCLTGTATCSHSNEEHMMPCVPGLNDCSKIQQKFITAHAIRSFLERIKP